MKKDSTRQSSFELMRILSMAMIVLWHLLKETPSHGNVINNCGREDLRLIFLFMMFIIVVHVNSYVLLTGYFQSKNKFKMSKLLKNINMIWFYRVIIMVICVILNLWHPTHIEILHHSFPLDLNFYWFMDIYLLLYCLSPFLNKYIDKLDKSSYRKMLVVLLTIFSLIPFITGLKSYANDGYTLCNFILLYFIGAYLRRYPIKNSYLFKNISKSLFQLICIFVFFGCAIFNFLLHQFFSSIVNYGSVFNEIGSSITYVTRLYSNPIVILQTISYFCFFETLTFKNKMINKVSATTLAVYLIHYNVILRTHLYSWFKISNRTIYSYKFIPYVFLVVFIIYILCTIVEFLRQYIFKFIYNRKISCKWRKIYRNFISSCGLNLNW